MRPPGAVPVTGPCQPGGPTGDRTGPVFLTRIGLLKEDPPDTAPDRFFLGKQKPIRPDRVHWSDLWNIQQISSQWHSQGIKGAFATSGLLVYDSRDTTSESAPSPSPPSSLMLVHRRCIGYCNPKCLSLSKSVRLTNLSEYDNST